MLNFRVLDWRLHVRNQVMRLDSNFSRRSSETLRVDTDALIQCFWWFHCFFLFLILITVYFIFVGGACMMMINSKSSDKITWRIQNLLLILSARSSLIFMVFFLRFFFFWVKKIYFFSRFILLNDTMRSKLCVFIEIEWSMTFSKVKKSPFHSECQCM